MTLPATGTNSASVASIASGAGSGTSTVTAKATATLTVTGTWQPANSNDPAPQSVILSEQVDAYALGTASNASGSIVPFAGSVSDGLGDSAKPDPKTGQVAGQKYTVDSGGSFTATLTISASVSATPGPPYELNGLMGLGTCTVSAGIGPVSISAYTPTVTLRGYTSVNGAQEALAGQQIKATLSLGSAPCKGVSGYNWTATPAGNLFRNYDPTATSGQLQPLSSASGDFTGSNFYFYDVHNNDTVTLTCTATVTFPDGTTGTVTAQSQPVMIVKPTAQWTVKEGYVQPFTSSQYPGDLLFGLRPDPATASQYPNGEDWYNVSLTIPSGFPVAGQGSFAQLVTPNHAAYQASSGTTQYYVPGQGLDNLYPYLSYSWSLPDPGNQGDNPCIVFDSNSQGYNPGTGDYVSAYDYFKTWLMYQPPAVGDALTIPAPVKTYGWSYAATATWNGSQWALSNAFPQTGSPAGDPSTPTDDYPQWTQVLSNQGIGTTF